MTDVCTCLDVLGEDPNCKLHGGPLRLAVFETFGTRCDQFDPECETCQAWSELDRIEALTAALPHMADTPCDHICMGECATDDCENCGIHHFEVGGVGSYYCGSCLKKIAALASHEPAPEPAKDGPEVVERVRKWCSETINQWSDECEPRENWERQVSGAMREWDKATTEIISDYEALRVENERLRDALEEIASDDEYGDYEGVVLFARAALKGQSNE